MFEVVRLCGVPTTQLLSARQAGLERGACRQQFLTPGAKKGATLMHGQIPIP